MRPAGRDWERARSGSPPVVGYSYGPHASRLPDCWSAATTSRGLTPRASASLRIFAGRGIASPFSHFVMMRGPTPIFSASSPCVSTAARHLRSADRLRAAPPDRAAHPAPPPRAGARRAWSPPWWSLRSARTAGPAVPRASCPSLNWHRERGQAPRPIAPGVAPAVRLRRALSRPPAVPSVAATPPGQGRSAALRVPAGCRCAPPLTGRGPGRCTCGRGRRDGGSTR